MKIFSLFLKFCLLIKKLSLSQMSWCYCYVHKFNIIKKQTIEWDIVWSTKVITLLIFPLQIQERKLKPNKNLLCLDDLTESPFYTLSLLLLLLLLLKRIIFMFLSTLHMHKKVAVSDNEWNDLFIWERERTAAAKELLIGLLLLLYKNIYYLRICCYD